MAQTNKNSPSEILSKAKDALKRHSAVSDDGSVAFMVFSPVIDIALSGEIILTVLPWFQAKKPDKKKGPGSIKVMIKSGPEGRRARTGGDHNVLALLNDLHTQTVSSLWLIPHNWSGNHHGSQEEKWDHSYLPATKDNHC
jgi:hypothetical protein